MPEDRAGDLLLQRARRPDRGGRAPGAPGDPLVQAVTVDLRVLDGALATVRLDAGEPVPPWATAGPAALSAVVRTPAELSIVCPQDAVPDGVRAERGWRALAVAGPLDLALTGVLAALAVPLAEAGVPVFALATYDTDYLLVPGSRLHEALAALERAGHRVRGD